ncbi:MAG: hypothetical protein HQM08_00435 [Candidatus Riflebacteria bacterium]|nr:hypothetical protein [Candidatus Riflebacteria bacterium]
MGSTDEKKFTSENIIKPENAKQVQQPVMMVPVNMEALYRLQGQETVGDDEIDLSEIFQTLWNRKILIIFFSLLLGILSISYSFSITPIYKAEVTFMPVESSSGSRMQAILGQLGGLGGLIDVGGGAEKGGINQFTMILKSRLLASAVIEKHPEVIELLFPKSKDESTNGESISQDIAATALSMVVSVNVPLKSDPPALSVELPNATMAAVIANSYMDELASYIAQNTFTNARKARLYIEEQSQKYQTELTEAENNLKDFQQEHKLISINAQTESVIKTLGELKAKLITKEMERDVLLKSTTANSPGVKKVEDEIVAMKDRLQQMEQGTEGFIANLKTEDLSNETELMSGSLASAPELILNFYRLKRKVEIAQKVYELLMQQLSMAKITEANESTSFRILDRAVIQKKKIRPQKSSYGIMGTMTGFFISLIFVFIDHRRNNPSKKILKQSEGTNTNA